VGKRKMTNTKKTTKKGKTTKKRTFTQDEVEQICSALFKDFLTVTMEVAKVTIDNMRLERKLKRVPKWAQRLLGIHK